MNRNCIHIFKICDSICATKLSNMYVLLYKETLPKWFGKFGLGWFSLSVHLQKISSPHHLVPAPNTTHGHVQLRVGPHLPLHLSKMRRNPRLLYSMMWYVDTHVGSGYTGVYYSSIWWYNWPISHSICLQIATLLRLLSTFEHYTSSFFISLACWPYPTPS